MKNFSLFSLFSIGLVLTGCKGNQGQFTQLSELEEAPFQEALESRVKEVTIEAKIGRKKALATDSGQVGQNGLKEDTAENSMEETTVSVTVVDVIIKPRTRPGDGKGLQKKDDCQCEKTVEKKAETKGRRGRKHAEKRDIHFYIGSAPGFCLNSFANKTYRQGFLSYLNDLNWWFSHSVFSSVENSPGYLEFDGRYLNSSHRTHKRKWEGVTVLHKRTQFYEDVFAYTVTPFVPVGDSFYHNHSADTKDSMISYDAPQRPLENKNGGDNPLAGLDDLLTKGYDVMRPETLADVFIITNQFPDYAPEEIDAFLNKHANLRIHGLLPKPALFKKTSLGSLQDLIEKTEGTSNQLCSDKNIGPKLAEIVADKNWTQKQKAAGTAREKSNNCGC